MTATERSFADPLPAGLYLDTDILLAYLVSTQLHHQRSRAFLERAFQEGRTSVYVSSLSWMEILQVIRREQFRNDLPEEMRREFRLDRWEDVGVRRRYVEGLLHLFDELLGQYDWFEIGLTREVRTSAAEYAVEYNLSAYDAVHLASATQSGVFDLASFDRGFRRVDRLVLWNDLIYSGAGA